MPETTAFTRTRWASIGAAIAITFGAAGIGSYNTARADIDQGDRPVFVAVTPCRLLDTRPGTPNAGPQDGPLGPDQTLTVTAHGETGRCTGPAAIPTDAVALSLNVTALSQTERTFLTIWDEGDDPGTSNLNPEPGQPPTPNAVNTPLSTTGTFNIRNNAGNVNVIADVVGYYANHNHDDRYSTEPEVEAAIQAAIDEITPAEADYPDALPITVGQFAKADGSPNAFVRSTIQFQSGQTSCFIAELPAPPTDRTLDSVDLLYSTQADTAVVAVQVSRSPNQLGGSGLASSLFNEPYTLPSGPSGALDSELRSMSVDARADTPIDSDRAHAINVCSVDAIVVHGVILNTSAA